MKRLVSVVVPFYNEEANVAPLARKVAETLDALPEYEYECIFVNDGSLDGTRAALEKAAAANPRVRPVHLKRNRGQSAALVAGMRAAKGECILTLDGDLQNDPCDFPNMLSLLQQYDCVCGYRAKRNDTWFRRLSSRVANRVRNAILHDGIRDSGCGSKGFRRCCVEHIVPFNGAHRFFAVMVRCAGLTIAECPVTHHPRVHGVSKYGLHNRLWRGMYDLIGVGWLRRRYVTYEIESEE
ncbi:MAG TPA: glycosyltransferase family 2 protein [Candidatus Hydrogenedentes bacterium]|nr:glycosyltransferase family 2 protein [Candidatus Hydrogenedentota bacterium]HOS03531.1 glycosyltransferase family 2 protein [Candidatus Hydrogenedentota bacterium]